AESLEVLESAAVPPAQARAIVRAIEIEIAGAKDVLATKHDMVLLRAEMVEMISSVRSELKSDIGQLRSDMKSEIGQLRAEMKSDAGQLRSDMQSVQLRPQLA